MPQTSIYGLDYPAASDLVASGYSQMQLLAGDVETALSNQTLANNTGYRNQITNPFFTQNQRVAAATSVADSWQYYVDSITGVTNTRNTLAATTGLPEWVNGSITQATASNAAGVARYVALQQTIPNVRLLGNTTVVVSFYAKASAGTPKVGVNLTQTFGTGGTPSTDVVLNGTAVTISTSWARYSATFTLASVIGKTLGTNNDDGTILRLWTSAGTNFNTQSGSIGLQTSTIDITGVQLELSYLTPLERRLDNPSWLQASNFGVFQSWTPAVRQGAADLATTVNYAGYCVVGKICFVWCSIKPTAAGTAGSQIRINSNGTLPAPRYYSTQPTIVGVMTYSDVGVGLLNHTVRASTGSGTDPSFYFYRDGAVGGATTPTIAANDEMYMTVWYELP